MLPDLRRCSSRLGARHDGISPGKRSRLNDDAGDRDRLSALPDCLLHEIMSYMKARQVVQTCVLSKRWTRLWRAVPCLDIDQSEFEAAGRGTGVHRTAWQKFEDFSVILLGNHVSIARLDAFRLSTRFFYDNEARHASGLIRRGIKYGTQEPGVQRERLTSRPWRLKRLHLSRVDLDEIFAEHLRSGCPSLEDLELSGCRCDFRAITSDSLKDLNLKCCRCLLLSEITSPTLKSLVIDSGTNSKGHPLVIKAPDLACLYMYVTTNNLVGGVSLNEMASLAKATILLWDDKTAQSKIRGDQLKILCSVSNVTSLVLSNFEMMVSAEASRTFPEFKNMRTLHLNYCNTSQDCQISQQILRNAPNLENLTLGGGKMLSEEPRFLKQEESRSFPEFRNLNVLSLRNCDLSDDFRTLGHFLRSSPNLRKLTLSHCKFVDDSEKKKGAPKSKKNQPSQCHNLVGVRCENLKHTEIVYRDDDIRLLVELLLHTSENFPNNSIKLRKTGSHTGQEFIAPFRACTK